MVNKEDGTILRFEILVNHLNHYKTLNHELFLSKSNYFTIICTLYSPFEGYRNTETPHNNIILELQQ